MTIDDLTLMAFADGELTGEEYDAVAAAVERDSALRERVEMFRATRQLTKQALSAVPVSSDLAQRVRSTAAQITQTEDARPTMVPFRPRPRFWLGAGAALAASLLMGVFIGVRLVQPVGGGQEAHTHLDLSAARPVLATLASGSEVTLDGGTHVAMIGSFRSGEGSLCREFEFKPGQGEGIVAISCFAEGDWRLRFAVAANVPDGENYAPASALDVLESYLQTIGASTILEADEEAAVLATLD